MRTLVTSCLIPSCWDKLVRRAPFFRVLSFVPIAPVGHLFFLQIRTRRTKSPRSWTLTHLEAVTGPRLRASDDDTPLVFSSNASQVLLRQPPRFPLRRLRKRDVFARRRVGTCRTGHSQDAPVWEYHTTVPHRRRSVTRILFQYAFNKRAWGRRSPSGVVAFPLTSRACRRKVLFSALAHSMHSRHSSTSWPVAASMSRNRSSRERTRRAAFALLMEIRKGRTNFSSPPSSGEWNSELREDERRRATPQGGDREGYLQPDRSWPGESPAPRCSAPSPWRPLHRSPAHLSSLGGELMEDSFI